jgi:universal stress protein E
MLELMSMWRFENILVGVDLSRRDRLVGKKLNRHASRAYESAVTLARLSGAHLHFLYALEVSVDAQKRIQTDRRLAPTILDIAEDRMKGLVKEACEEGINATGSVVFGRSWLALIREVLKGNYDLVMIGTRKLGTLKSVLMGSIGIQLLRKCPCPVWISKEPIGDQLDSILLASDKTPAGDTALELASGLAELHHSELHVLHSLEGYESTSGQPEQMSVEDVVSTKEHIAVQLSESGLSSRARVQLAKDSSFCTAISDHLSHHENNLLVLGTSASDGISRMIKRGRSERLLSRVSCSLIAVKPSDFVCPVKIEELESPTASRGAA